jgi:hypothetical protein
MSADQVIDAWGQPNKVVWDDTSSDGGRRTRWQFRRGYKTADVDLKNGVVTRWEFTN